MCHSWRQSFEARTHAAVAAARQDTARTLLVTIAETQLENDRLRCALHPIPARCIAVSCARVMGLVCALCPCARSGRVGSSSASRRCAGAKRRQFGCGRSVICWERSGHPTPDAAVVGRVVRETVSTQETVREEMQLNMKQAFMRGVCALNIEAMSVMSASSPSDAAPLAPGIGGFPLGRGEEVIVTSSRAAAAPNRGAKQVVPEHLGRSESSLLLVLRQCWC